MLPLSMYPTVPNCLLLYPDLGYIMNTQQVFRAGDIGDSCRCPAEKRNVSSLAKTADLLKMGGLERVDDSGERLSPTILHYIVRVSVCYHRFTSHQLLHS